MKKKMMTLSICVLFITSGCIALAGSAAAAWWPMEGHDAAHTGYIVSEAPDTPYVFLEDIFGGVGGGPEGPLVVVNGYIYGAISEEMGSIDVARLICADANTGAIVWEYQFGPSSAASSLTYYEGKIFIIADDYLDPAHSEQRIICFNAETGQKEWFVPVDNAGGLVVADVRIFFREDFTTLKCLDLTGGELWNYTVSNTLRGYPTIYNGRVYIAASTSTAATIYCLDTGGNEIWTYAIAEGVDHTITASDNKVYVVSKSNLYCLDAVGSGGTTTQIWKKTGIDYYSGPTAVVEDRLYFGNGRLLTCLNADTGSPIWTYNSGHPNKRFKIQPTIADNKIFTGFGTGYKMIVLDAIGTGSTTTLLWEFPLQHDIQGDVTVQPVVADGKCYLFTSRGFIYGFFDHLNPPTIEGPTEGYANTMYTFTASSQPFLEFQYLFSFGDGEDSYWIPEGSVDIGEEVTVTHSYGEPGTYDVRVKIRHEDTGLESDWSEPVSIHINRLKIMSISGGMGVTATIKNMGDYAKDVQWTIDVIGGTFPGFHINKGSEGSIEPLAAQDTAVITVPTFIGLGKFKITINAECPGESTLTETYDAKVLFFYVII